MALGNYHRTSRDKGQGGYCNHRKRSPNANDGDAAAPSPMVMGVVNLGRGQRDPTDILIRTYPRDSSRIPTEAGSPSNPHFHAHNRWRPEPPTINVNPVTVVMGDVAKRFIGHPTLVAIIVDPPAAGKRPPVGVDVGRSPHFLVFILVVDPFPSSILIQYTGVIMQLPRKISCGFTCDFLSFFPQSVPVAVPAVPRGIHGPGTGRNRMTVRQQGW